MLYILINYIKIYLFYYKYFILFFIEIIFHLKMLIQDEEKIFHVIDFPGHYKLRYKYQDFTPITKGVIFVIDSATFTKNERDVSEYLYEILANKHIQENEVSVLIVCNKQDYLIALPKERIKSALENEM